MSFVETIRICGVGVHVSLMVSSRLATALVGLVLSIVVSAVLAWYFNVFFLFLFLPLVPFLFRQGKGGGEPDVFSCPRCGFRTRNPDYVYCPRDGVRLEEEG